MLSLPDGSKLTYGRVSKAPILSSTKGTTTLIIDFLGKHIFVELM